jgi:hypothetical protein
LKKVSEPPFHSALPSGAWRLPLAFIEAKLQCSRILGGHAGSISIAGKFANSVKKSNNIKAEKP